MVDHVTQGRIGHRLHRLGVPPKVTISYHCNLAKSLSHARAHTNLCVHQAYEFRQLFMDLIGRTFLYRHYLNL